MKRNPWAWIPTLYFAEGLPNVVVMSLAVVMYMKMGMTDTEIGFYTGWLGLPWVIKPLWSPFIDLFKTKRWWVLSMQLLLGAAFAGVAFTVNTGIWFQGTMFFFFLMAFASATHDIAADGFYMIELDSHHQSAFVGIRNTFYRVAVVFGQGVLVWLSGQLQDLFPESKAFVWSLIFFALSGIFIAIWLYHRFVMPHPADRHNERQTAADIWAGLKQMLSSFFTKVPVRQMAFVLLFLLFYRFPEALLTKMASTFLLRPVADGGLGMTEEAFGVAYGTVGVIGLLFGGIVGGLLASRDGLKRWLWPFVCAITLPDIVYVYLSFAQPDNIYLISGCLFVEQFGYGLGFTALTLYMLYFSQGEFKTSHYAICTGLSYLGLMLPGMVSGWLKDMMGYQSFFILVMLLCTITFAVTAFIKIDPEFGKKKQQDTAS